MIHKNFLKNARSAADRFFRSGFAFLAFLALFFVIFASLARFVNMAKHNEIQLKRGLYRMMETDMSKCAQIGVKMQYAGADYEEELLPMLDIYLYSLNSVTQAFCESFGENTSPVRRQFLSKVENAKERFERDLNAGYPYDESKKSLEMYLNEFSEILDKWDYQ
ncbi:MAG: hypothetical protein IKJ65_06945 [Clostridia bacterium]|nr:hypothetical protein [Clostridia bacterium]